MRSLIIPRTVRASLLTAALVVFASLLVCVSLAWLAADVSKADIGAASVAPSVSATATLASPCMEDEPCWTWSRMGNRTRGVVTRYGNPLVVGPCRFARMHRAHRLDPHNERMRGDAWAIVHGCEA